MRDQVELPQQPADHFVRIVLAAQLLEPCENPGQRRLGLEDGVVRKRLPLLLQSPLMFDELFAVELGPHRRGGGTRARLGAEAV